MHYRVGPRVGGGDLRGRDLATILPLVAVIVALGVYPQALLGRTEAATTPKVVEAHDLAAEGEATAGQPAPAPPARVGAVP